MSYATHFFWKPETKGVRIIMYICTSIKTTEKKHK